jgi:glycosyltransferase involved in cell wall biosynthesis
MRFLRSRPDITGVHFQEWTLWMAARMFRQIRAMGTQIFYTAHNVVPHKFPRGVPKSVVLGWIRKAARLADGLFVHTDKLADEFSRFLGPGHPPIQVVPHGIWSIPGLEAPGPLHERLASRKLLLFGMIRANKGTDLLLRAMDHLEGFSVTVAGLPLDREYFAAEILPQIQRLRARGVQVDLIDRFVTDEEVASLFASHSAVVLPYTRAFVAQSGVAFMALAYQAPIVASEVGGMRELFDEFKIGTTFADPTPQALASAIQELYATPVADLDNQIQLARRRYSWQESARATIAGYTQATEKVSEEHDCPITSAIL